MKATTDTPSPGYETTDALPRVAVMTALVLVIGVVLSLLAAAGFYIHRNRPFVGDGHARRETSFRDGPSQRTSIEIDWSQLQADTRSHLESYGWVDRSKGVVRIPITRAMELLVTEQSGPAPPANSNSKGATTP